MCVRTAMHVPTTMRPQLGSWRDGAMQCECLFLLASMHPLAHARRTHQRCAFLAPCFAHKCAKLP